MLRNPHDEPTETVVDGLRRSGARRVAAPVVGAQPTLMGRYVVLSELGRGGMSVVYAAYDPELDRRVALKVVRADQLSATHRARLHREAQALARLSHPSVVTVFDVGDLATDTFVAMELVDGVSLRDWLKQPHTWREVVRVVVAAGRGLAAAHAAGIVHRDVKPDNIMLAPTGAVKLVDFGLARDLGDRSIDSSELLSEDPVMPPEIGSELTSSSSSSGSMNAAKPLEAITQHGHIVGTPAYMPPEQRGKKPEADERSDQFSLCATLYEALYHQRPFTTSKKEVLDRHELVTVAERPGPDSRTLAAPPPKGTDVPAWLQKVVTRGLAVDPRQRYPSVEALLADLDRDPARTMRRAATAAGVLVAVAALATVVTWKMMPTQHAAAPTCGTGADRIAQRWNGDRRDELARAAATRGGVPAVSAMAVFGARVEHYAADWQAMFHTSCEATQIQHTQSAEAMDLRSACLDRRLAELGALVDVMHDAGPEVLRKAGETVDGLPPIADCGDLKALREVVRRPSEPAIARRLDAIDGDLARLTALYAIGDMTKTLALGDTVIKEARDAGYAPQLAEALYWRGRAIADRDGGADAEAMFDQTFAAALAAGQDQRAADAAARIAQEALWAAHLPEFERWSRIAHALAARSSATNVTRFVDQLGCMANHWTGRVRTRLACLRELAARKDGTPDEWLVTTLGIAASEAGEPAEAIHWLERGVELARAENGADHPRTIEMRAYLCHGLSTLGDFDRAAGECRDALERLLKIAPDDHALVARLQLYLADTQTALHRPDDARPLLEAALAGGDDEIKLAAKSELSELAGKKSDAAAAIAEHRDSLAETTKVFAPFNPHHPNILAEHHELGIALLEHGDAAGALAELTRADEDADPTEISPLELAQIRFARAQSLVKAHGDQVKARALASGALDLYRQHAPDTARFRDERAEIEHWLATVPGQEGEDRGRPRDRPRGR
jgi:eukaryotic-like serine/threonine-protein kinase